MGKRMTASECAQKEAREKLVTIAKELVSARFPQIGESDVWEVGGNLREEFDPNTISGKIIIHFSKRYK